MNNKFSIECASNGSLYISVNGTRVGADVSMESGVAILNWMKYGPDHLKAVLAGDNNQVIRDLCDEIVEKFEGKQATMTDVVMYLREKVAKHLSPVTP